jgi:6-pyruvoyltetrahydropterin/6-carboxytetrahydropterin synthase
MAGKYTIKVVSQFSAAHMLIGYDGPCARLHGHNWQVEAEVVATQLNNAGIAIDFKIIKQALKKVLEQVDHQFLNEIPPFTEINPTAENVAAWVYQEIGPLLNSETVKVSAINLWETDNARVRYTEE